MGGVPVLYWWPAATYRQDVLQKRRSSLHAGMMGPEDASSIFSVRLSHRFSGPQPHISQEKYTGTLIAKRGIGGKWQEKGNSQNKKKLLFILGCIFKLLSPLK